MFNGNRKFLIEKIKSRTPKNEFENLNKQSLKEVLDLFNYLKNQGKLNESQFNSLSEIALSNYYKNDIEFRVSNFLNKSINKIFN
jgi:hypothetical protein